MQVRLARRTDRALGVDVHRRGVCEADDEARTRDPQLGKSKRCRMVELNLSNQAEKHPLGAAGDRSARVRTGAQLARTTAVQLNRGASWLSRRDLKEPESAQSRRSPNSSPVPPTQEHANASSPTTRESSSGGLAARLVSLVAAFGVARQSVVGDRLPWGGVRNELADTRANARVAVERSHPYRYRFGVTWIETEE